MDKQCGNQQILGYNASASSPQKAKEDWNMQKHSYSRNGIVYVKGTINGQRYRLSTGKRASKRMLEFVNLNWESEIQAILLHKHEHEKEQELKAKLTKSQISLKDFCQKLVPIWERTLKRSSFLGRSKLLSTVIYPHFGTSAMSDLHYTTLREWFFNFRLKNNEIPSASYLAHIASLLNQIFVEAIKDGIIETNPMSGLKKPKQLLKNEPPMPFSVDEIARLLCCKDAFVRDFAAIAFFTGMRTGELLALAWDCIDFENDTIAVERNATKGGLTTPKTGKRRIDMLPCVKQKLLEMKARASSIWVFPTRQGGHYQESNSIVKKWQRALFECNIAYRSVYHTRHTFATTMISAGEDILWVSATLGHANTQMTFSRYAKYIPKTRGSRASIVEQNIAQLLAQNENTHAG